MGMKLLSTLNSEIDKNVKTALYRDVAKYILKSCDDLNATEAASSSGKYHPIADLGYQGLIRHSKMVAELVNIMVRAIPQYDSAMEHDIVYISALLHDMCKYEAKEGEEKVNTNSDHPTKMMELVRKASKDYITELEAAGKPAMTDEQKTRYEADWERVASNIGSHMSRWNEIKDYSSGRPKVVGYNPLPTTFEQYIIVFADLISANATLPETMFDMKNEAIGYITGRLKAE